MENKTMLLAALTAVVTIATFCICKKNKEEFTAPGLVYNIPSEWWHPQKYDATNWLVPLFPDQLSQPDCLSYNRGNPEVLNFNSIAYRFWRF